MFLPVLDAPQRVQLHAALDAASAVPLYAGGGEKDKAVQDTDRSSSVFPLDRDAMLGVLQMVKESGAAEDARSRRVREIAEEGWDLFLRVLADGSLVVQAVAVGTSRLVSTLVSGLLYNSVLIICDRISIAAHPRSSGTLPCSSPLQASSSLLRRRISTCFHPHPLIAQPSA